mmetsp:Transcript_20292/g.32690  ORF Transcript_20292/g.32690 Transcript_20292/m.32690 type:complete len:104 (+) Transcript_20292:534-845(+)
MILVSLRQQRKVRSRGSKVENSFSGETHELRQELNHQNRDKKRSTVKKVIANMTVGKDVSMLFPDVVNCMQTGNDYFCHLSERSSRYAAEETRVFVPDQLCQE